MPGLDRLSKVNKAGGGFGGLWYNRNRVMVQQQQKKQTDKNVVAAIKLDVMYVMVQNIQMSIGRRIEAKHLLW